MEKAFHVCVNAQSPVKHGTADCGLHADYGLSINLRLMQALWTEYKT